MTAYAAIPDSDVDPESPGTTTLFVRLRDNPVAISEGTLPAPKIQTAAYQDLSVTDAKLSTTVTAAGIDWVSDRTTSAAVGDIGTYAFLSSTFAGTAGPGYTALGSSLFYACSDGAPAGGTTSPAGTWRLMGSHLNTDVVPWASVWQRIS